VAQPPPFELVGLLFGGILIMLALALALVFFFVFYQKKVIRQQDELRLVQAAYQKALLTAAIQAEEKERRRIGSDLHDDMGSALSAARLLISQIATSPTASAADQELVTAAKSILDDSIQDIRHVSKNLYPVVLARFGLAEALRNLPTMWERSLPDGLLVRVALTASLTYDQQLALYRIVQELITNALRHGKASRVSVELLEQPGQLQLVVADNGVGFDYDRTREGNVSGLGLKSLEARVTLLDATLLVDSAPGQGTRIQVITPLPEGGGSRPA
jgi:signal transduction histidine kinase